MIDPVTLTLITGGLAILGTLLGVGVSSVMSWQIQKRQLKHADSIRFHEHRLTAYAEFSSAAGTVFGHCSASTTPTVAEVAAFVRAFEVVHLIGSNSVVDAAAEVQTDVHELLLGTNLDRKALAEQFSWHMGKAVVAMRGEMGTSKPTDTPRSGSVVQTRK